MSNYQSTHLSPHSEKANKTRRTFLAATLSNVSMAWKMALMAFVLSLGILGITVSSYAGMQSLRYQLSNIYDFMLIPIVAINHADTALADTQFHIQQLHAEEITPDQMAKGLADIQSNDQTAEETIARYDTEWVTTVSPEFTQALTEAGKLELQRKELAVLDEFHTSFEAYKVSREKYLITVRAGQPDVTVADEAIEKLEAARVNLQNLIDINNDYAAFSNELAQAAYRQAVLSGSIVLAVALVLGFFMSYLIVVSITSRLGELTHSASALQAGNLDQAVTVTGRDEVSLLGATFNNMAAQLKSLFATLEQRVKDRTKALETSTDVSRRLSSILDLKLLVAEVVEQLQAAFAYYHVHIYLLDEAGEYLVLAGGTGQAGRTLLERGHKIAREKGLVGRAAETKDIVLVPDTGQEPGWLPNPLLPETKSEIAVPILAGSQVLGVLDVQNNTAESLTQQDADLIGSIANQIAVAIQNIRQYEKTRKTAAELELAASVSTAAATIIETERLLQEVVDLTKESFGLYHAHIYLLNAAGDTLELASGAGEVGKRMVAEGRTIPLDREQSLVARAARTREGVIANNVRSDPDFLPHPLLPETRSEMAVPMVIGDKVIGVFDVQSSTANHFTEADTRIQTTLASQVAVAVQNARTFEQTQRRAMRESALNVIGQKIQSAATIEAALQTAARELGHALGMKPTLVALDPALLESQGK